MLANMCEVNIIKVNSWHNDIMFSAYFFNETMFSTLLNNLVISCTFMKKIKKAISNN